MKIIRNSSLAIILVPFGRGAGARSKPNTGRLLRTGADNTNTCDRCRTEKKLDNRERVAGSPIR